MDRNFSEISIVKNNQNINVFGNSFTKNENVTVDVHPTSNREKTGKQFVDRYLKPVSLEANILSFSGSRRPYSFTTNESVDI